MRRLVPVALVSALGVLTASGAAAPTAKPKRGDVSAQFLGEGGGYKHPDAEAGGFLEAAPAESPNVNPKRRPDGARRREAAAAAETDSAAVDSASDEARRDYESRLLGAAPESARPALTGAPGGAALPNIIPYGQPSGALRAPEGSLFVQLELDPREAGSLRDAVAGLGAAAAFRPDVRFQPLPGEGGSVRISGWLPVSRLSDAIARPGVKRVAVERVLRSRAASGVVGDFLVGLRVADAAHLQESVSAGVKDLAQSAGFIVGNAYKVGRVFGVETAPDGGAVAVVAGSLPLSRLSRAMGRPGVVRVISSSTLRRDAATEERLRTGGFLRFVRTRGWWLALVTILMVLPILGKALKNGLAVFVPYR